MWSKNFLVIFIFVHVIFVFSKIDFDHSNSCPVQFPCPGNRAVARDENNCPICAPLINITAVCVTECPVGCSSQANKKGCKLCYCPRQILTAFLPDDDPQFRSFKSDDSSSTIDFCNEDKDCKNAYSYCKAKKCVCVEGLERINGVCVAPAASHNCPYRSPLSEGKIIKACEYAYDNENRVEISTCPEKHFCFVWPQTRSKSGKMVGHCCPVPSQTTSSDSSSQATAETVCPFGQPVKEASCPDTSDLPADSAAPPNKIRTCPHYTHECVNNKYNKTQVCCLNPCRASSSHFDVEGKCYDYVLIGDRCGIDAQCIGGSKCKLNDKNMGVCTCKSGSDSSSRTTCHDEKKKTHFEDLRLPKSKEIEDSTVCKRGFIKDGALCREISYLTEKCSSNEECITLNTECRSGVCVCKAGLLRDGFICKHPLKIKEVCKGRGDCRTSGTSCVKGKCVCDRNYVRVAENCIEITFLTCKSDAECKFANTTCSSGKCVCLPTHVRDGDVCIDKTYVNETCKATSDCKTQNSRCNNEICVCPLGHLRDGNACNLTVTLQACSSQSDCSKWPNSWCSVNRCVCMPGYSREGGSANGACKMSLSTTSDSTGSVYGTCTNDGDCHSVSGSVCVSGKCACMSGYNMENKRCVASPDISTSIDEPGTKIKTSDTQFCQKQEDCQTFQGTTCKENKCQCMDGYIQDGVICTKFDDIDKSCKTNEDCSSSFTCQLQKCVCFPGYVRDGNICVKPETVFMTCTNNTDCRSMASSFCSAKRCVCMKGYIRDGIVCRMPASITSGCDKDIDCRTPSTFCRENKCVCMSTYVRDGISCVSYESLSQACNEDRDCSSVNSTVCQAGKCVCMAGYERLDDGQCRIHSSTVAAKIAELGGVVPQCTYNSECTSILKSSVCIESQCVCMSGYLLDGNTCRPIAEITENCTTNNICKTKSSICLQGKCVCMAGYVRQNDACELVVPNKSCAVSDDCRINLSVCLNQKCACMSGYLRDGDACVPEDFLNDTCQQDNDCSKIKGSICRESKCVCMPGYTKDGGECNLSVFLKETCRLDSDCKSAGTFCRNGKCICMPNYVRHANLCVNTKLYQSPAKCKTNSDCTMPNTACADDECVCMDGYEIDGGYCISRNYLPEKCKTGSDCYSPGTTCQNERCVCMNGYRRVNSVCQKLLTTSATPVQPDIFANVDTPAVSEVLCKSTEDCDVPANSVCNEGKCVCMNSDYIRDGDVCVQKSDILSLCDAKHKCLTETAICSENKCVCMSGYIKDGENCVKATFMPETCKTDLECSIPGTVCRLKRCVCMASYIRDGTACAKLENLALNCTKDNLCSANQTCVSGKCACASSYVRVSDQFCELQPPIKVCRTGLNCPPGAFCLNGKCYCMTGYRTVGNTCVAPTTDSGTTKNCLSELDCKETGTTCQDGSCVCMDGYVKAGDTCKPLETGVGETDICSLPMVTGNCRASIAKWYWNPTKGCQTFIYGGCGGNENRFDSKEECESSCAKEKTNLSTDSNKIEESIDQPSETADKSRQLEKACASDSDCTVPYSNCRSQICTCGEGFTVQGNACVPEGKSVGESCVSDIECYMAFSKCIKQKCSCIDGFIQTPGGSCAPEKYNCPYGEPKNETGSVVMCEISPLRTFESMPDASTCMAGYFCFASPHTKAISGRLLGHCCPLPVDGTKVQPVCPVDVELKGASCSERPVLPNRIFRKPASFLSEPDNSGGCPASTHECLVSRYLPKTICCPLPCKNGPDRVNVQGKCYRRVMDGYVCEIDAQCDPNSYCSFDSSGMKRCRSSFWKRF